MSRPPGWYHVPGDSSGALEWWDGAMWSGDRWSPPLITALPGLEQTTSSRPSRKLLAFLLAVAIVLAYVGYRSWEHQNLIEYRETTFVEIDHQAPSRFLLGGSLDETEAMALDYAPSRDANGSFVTSGQHLTRMFGVELRWGDIDAAGPCERPDGDSYTVVAWYCEGNPYVIDLHRDAGAMPYHLYEESFIDTVKHELAHHIIDARCGTSHPAVAGDLLEGVTNSYSVLYLGADREALADTAVTFPEYTMSPETDAIAARLRVGDCR